MKKIKVVAAIIIKDNKVLATRRSYGEFKNGWEFPGGKVEIGEDSKVALIREIKEEISANLVIHKHFATIEYTYPNFHMQMECYICSIDDFKLNSAIHDDAKWLDRNTLDSVQWLSADVKIVNRLKIYLSNKIAVSACLLGDNCKYNGGNNYDEIVEELLENKTIIKVCPENITKLGTPREPVEISRGKVINKKNEDLTEIYLEGVEKTWHKLENENIDLAILKAKSPTCGSGKIYDGSFSHILIEGNGLLTKKLKEQGIQILSEQDLK